MSEKTERNIQLEVINNIVRICKGYHDCDNNYIAIRKYIKLCYDLYNKNVEDINDESVISDKDIYQFLINNLGNNKYVALSYENLYKEVVDIFLNSDCDENTKYKELSLMLMRTIRNVIIFTGNEHKEQQSNNENNEHKEQLNNEENENVTEDITD